jgi:uncharacterized protein YecE (DUF72 family)
MTLFIGTSGWAYKEWKPDFYPEELPQKRFLEHYARFLSACEINATFYRLQSPDTFRRWAEGTSDTFRFSIKAHRGLTHSKSIAPTDKEGLLTGFLESVGTLGDRLGVVLLQFPPYRRRDDEDLAALMDALPSERHHAFEFRHESWDDPAVKAAIAERGGTICLSETKGEVPEELPPGPLAYVRLRAERYSDAARDGWRALLEKESSTRDVYAFAKHEGIPAGDPYGGIGLAQWLCSAT